MKVSLKLFVFGAINLCRFLECNEVKVSTNLFLERLGNDTHECIFCNDVQSFLFCQFKLQLPARLNFFVGIFFVQK